MSSIPTATVSKSVAKLILLLGISSATAADAFASNEFSLPAVLAVEAASEAVRACNSDGYNVSAAVVDASGELRAFIKGDNSTAHTRDSSFRKAYTVVSMGPIFKFDVLSTWVEQLKLNPNAPALASIPNIMLLPGAVALKASGEIVAAIGVGGAPGGEKDEACAAAGLTKIKSRLPQ